jgi:endonuclease/exonuclease/phosphatase family metal-dependent hydrolase
MTWNVWWRFGPRWRDRQAGLLRTIREVDPDVVAMQESWATASATQAGEFAAALGFHHTFGAPSLPRPPDVPEHPDQVGVDLGIGLMSRWPITSTHVVPLPARHRPEAPVAVVAVETRRRHHCDPITRSHLWKPRSSSISGSITSSSGPGSPANG